MQQIDLLACTVEVRGDSGEKMQTLLTTAKATPSIALTEYAVTPDSEGRRTVSKKKSKKGTVKSILLQELEYSIFKKPKIASPKVTFFIDFYIKIVEV